MAAADNSKTDAGETIGILGGGQLGRMLAFAAARLGFAATVYDPDPECPAAQVAQHSFHASYNDEYALARFAERCDRITFEFENVPVETVEFIGARNVPVLPGVEALRISQDRLVEKQFLVALGIETAQFESVRDIEHLEIISARFGECLLKTRRFGYDGKGQLRINEGDMASTNAATLLEHDCIIERRVGFTHEISIIAARAAGGQFVAYDPIWNQHENGILRMSTVPAPIDPETGGRAAEITRKIMEAVDYVGVIGVEFFLLADKRLLVNEFAPRVHNSGHWTEAACSISQFENHVRALCCLPLGGTDRHSDCTMRNLIGDEIEDIETWLRQPGCVVHNYGKSAIRAGRKMGHVTCITPRSNDRR